MRTLYLAGPINGCTDAECIDWRRSVTDALGTSYTILDPMRRDYRGREDDSASAIVDGDLADIAASDVVLVNAQLGASWGTAMEVREAYRTGRRVYAVCPIGPVSPWLRYHSHVRCVSVAQAINLLAREARELAA